MPWLKVDSGMYDHPKFEKLSLSQVGLWVRCASYAANKLTDGHVSGSTVRKLGGRPGDIDALLAVGLWETNGDGIVIHDFLKYNPSKAKVEADQEAARARMANLRRDERGMFA